MARQIEQELIYATGFFGKFCTKCYELKPASEYSPNKKAVSGLFSTCKECNRKKQSARLKDPRTRPSILKTMNSCRLKRAYGLTIEERDAMVARQGGKCAICDKSFDTLVVDHNHDTGSIRGMLCYNCNSGIGMLGDSIETIESAIKYLKRSIN